MGSQRVWRDLVTEQLHLSIYHRVMECLVAPGDRGEVCTYNHVQWRWRRMIFQSKVGVLFWDMDAGQISSVAHSCLTLCDPMDCSTPGFPILYYLPELLKHPTMSFSVILLSSHLQSFPASGSFQMSKFFPSGGQSIGVSASASVLPMKIRDWFPLGWTDWISLHSPESSPTPQFKTTNSWLSAFSTVQLTHP